MSNTAENSQAPEAEVSDTTVSANRTRLGSMFMAVGAGANFGMAALHGLRAMHDPSVQFVFGRVGTPLIGLLGGAALATLAYDFSKEAARKTAEEAVKEYIAANSNDGAKPPSAELN